MKLGKFNKLPSSIGLRAVFKANDKTNIDGASIKKKKKSISSGS